MHVIFPLNPLNPSHADGPFKDEYEKLKTYGVACSLFDFDALDFGEFSPSPGNDERDLVLYRGWMMSPLLYGKLVDSVDRKGGAMLTSKSDFIDSHHLPQWYPSLRSFTAETLFADSIEQAETAAISSGWQQFFVKDFVKSNYDKRGSIANNPGEIAEIIELIKAHRGELEGGISLRKVEAYIPETERRYFVFKSKPYSADGLVPNVVRDIAKIHRAPFYSVDMIERADGELRLVEIGDGQVSDRKTWDVDIFCGMIKDNNV